MRRHALMLIACAIVAMSIAASSAGGASSSVVVTMDVASATRLVTTGCSTPGSTSLGTVLPNVPARTPLPCTLEFGSSNDTAALRIAQRDARGVGMYQPADGTLDPGFGSGGWETISAPSDGDEQAWGGAVVQADGRIVQGGHSNGAGDWDFVLTRWNADGTHDNTFATGGYLTLDEEPADWIFDVDQMPDGDIVATGVAIPGCWCNSDIVVIRTDADGTLDTDFDGEPGMPGYPGNGIARYELTGFSEQPHGMDVAADGSIIISGFAFTAAGFNHSLTMTLQPDGQLDTSFAGTGWIAADYAASGGQVSGASVALADGRIASIATLYMLDQVAVVMRNPDGTLDDTFDGDPGNPGYPGNGIVRMATAGTSSAVHRILQDNEGRLLISGADASADDDAFLLRLQLDGTRDTAFGTGGFARVDDIGTDDQMSEPYVDDRDRIVVIGSRGPAGGSLRPWITRWTDDGDVDPTFSDDGHDQPFAQVGQFAHVLDPGDGAIVGVGHIDTGGSNNDWFVLRYESVPVDDYVDGSTDWDAGDSAFGACLDSVGAGTAASWVPNAGCSQASDGAWWNGVPADTGSASALVATASNGVDTATASLYFGARPSASNHTGSFVAPIAIEVVAPG